MIKNVVFRSLTLVILSFFIVTIGLQAQEENVKKEKKRKDEFKVMVGMNFNHLSIDENYFTSSFAPGFQLGGSYKRGKFFYWELGLEYDNSAYQLNWKNVPDSVSWFDGLFSVRNIEVPVTVGINILSITSRVIGLRAFIGADPTFLLAIGDNDINISKDDLNTFNINGRVGIGVDVAFLFVELGFQYGFQDLLKNDIKSNPMHGYLNLGFRF
jgi:hypothetical protein